MKSKIYLAGPMRGYDCFNFPAFHDAADNLRARGWIVHSPAEHDEANGFDPTSNDLEGFDIEAAFAWDIEQVLWCDYVVLLPGWRASEGANIEVTVAKATGKGICEYNGPNKALSKVTPEPVTLEAHRIVLGARRKEYGHPVTNFTRIAKLWSIVLDHDVSIYQVGLCMIALKLAREINSPTRDGRVDIAGYAETLEIVSQ
jgi:Domain of unknown function (DUF6378)/Domain of unknown function (DUF4406)